MNKTKREVLDSIKATYHLYDYVDERGAFHSADRAAERIFKKTTADVPKKKLRTMMRGGLV